MTANPVVLFYVTSMPCEVGVAALATMTDKFQCVGFTIDQTKDEKYVKTILDDLKVHRYPDIVSVVCLGTYWNHVIKQYSRELVTFNVYSYGSTDLKDSVGLTVVNGEERKIGPATYVIDLIENFFQFKSSCFSSFVQQFRPVIKTLDDRIFNRDILQTQMFFAGLYNIPDIDINADAGMVVDTYRRFLHLFYNRISYEKVMEIGRSVLGCQLGIAKERALENSREVEFQNGKRFRITNGPELINLTHNALHENFPECDGTMTVCWRFSSGKKDQLQFSFRSWNDETDVRPMAQAVTGDGSSKAAGGRFDCPCPIPMENISS